MADDDGTMGPLKPYDFSADHSEYHGDTDDELLEAVRDRLQDLAGRGGDVARRARRALTALDSTIVPDTAPSPGTERAVPREPGA